MTTGKPKLTAKQERFCELIALEGMTQADAYRQAYDCSKWTDKSVWEKASSLASDVKVKSRIEALKAEIAAKTVEKELWSRVDSITVLKDIATDHEARGNEKVSAVKELNAMHGFSTSKVELSGSIELQAEFQAYIQSKKVYEDLTPGQLFSGAIHGATSYLAMDGVAEERGSEIAFLIGDAAKLLANTSHRANLLEACKRVLSELEGYAFE